MGGVFGGGGGAQVFMVSTVRVPDNAQDMTQHLVFGPLARGCLACLVNGAGRQCKQTIEEGPMYSLLNVLHNLYFVQYVCTGKW